MPSSFSWLDYSERERRQAQQVISLFKESDTRDELGLAGVRDALAELFFPGTSTIQTRARYFLFVPWLYRWLEAQRYSSGKVGAKLRAEELKMIETLLTAGETAGVIGSTSRKNLQRTPSSIYWAGLGEWGIRTFNGSQEQYHASLDSFYSRNRGVQRADDGEPIDGVSSGNWHAGLPPAPQGFPNGLKLGLTRSEAEYLRERIMLTQSDSLLRFLVSQGESTDKLPFVWDHHQYDDFPADIKVQLEHARSFSEIMHGAALLYNLMLAEIAPGDWTMSVDAYRHNLEVWGERMRVRRGDYARWNLEEFWRLLAQRNARVPIRTQKFISDWIALALGDGAASIADSTEARRIVQEREIALKHGRARLVNRRSLELWSGASGSAQLNFRWRGSEIIVNDILNGLATEENDA